MRTRVTSDSEPMRRCFYMRRRASVGLVRVHCHVARCHVRLRQAIHS